MKRAKVQLKYMHDSYWNMGNQEKVIGHQIHLNKNYGYSLHNLLLGFWKTIISVSPEKKKASLKEKR